MEGVELLRRIKKDNLLIDNLPPIYLIFAKNYALGREGLKIRYFKFNEDLIQLTSATYVGNKGYENSISHLFDELELENEMKNYKMNIDDYHRQGLIKIGLFDINDSILLGVSEENRDTIWKLNGNWGDNRPYKEKLADNIFEFINCLKEVIIRMNLLVRKVDEDQLYKNWGEEFWKVKSSHETQ